MPTLKGIKQRARRLLRAEAPEPYNTRRLLDFLDGYRDGQKSAPSSNFRKNALAMALLYITPGAGGLMYMLKLGRELARQRGLDVTYYSIAGQDHEQSWQILKTMDPELRREQFVQKLNFEPEFLMATAWPTAYAVLQHPARR